MHSFNHTSLCTCVRLVFLIKIKKKRMKVIFKQVWNFKMNMLNICSSVCMIDIFRCKHICFRQKKKKRQACKHIALPFNSMI